MAGVSLWGGFFCPECLSQMRVVRSIFMSVTVQNLNDNPRPSYSNFANWPPSAILDNRGGHTWTIQPVAGTHFPCTRK